MREPRPRSSAHHEAAMRLMDAAEEEQARGRTRLAAELLWLANDHEVKAWRMVPEHRYRTRRILLQSAETLERRARALVTDEAPTP